MEADAVNGAPDMDLEDMILNMTNNVIKINVVT